MSEEIRLMEAYMDTTKQIIDLKLKAREIALLKGGLAGARWLEAELEKLERGATADDVAIAMLNSEMMDDMRAHMACPSIWEVLGPYPKAEQLADSTPMQQRYTIGVDHGATKELLRAAGAYDAVLRKGVDYGELPIVPMWEKGWRWNGGMSRPTTVLALWRGL